MIGAPVTEAGPARRLAVGGALLELAVERKMEQAMGITAEPLHTGHAGQLMRASKLLTVGGAAGAALLAAAAAGRRAVRRRLMAGSPACGSGLRRGAGVGPRPPLHRRPAARATGQRRAQTAQQ
jgi:hypothetical protein